MCATVVFILTEKAEAESRLYIKSYSSHSFRVTGGGTRALRKLESPSVQLEVVWCFPGKSLGNWVDGL